MEDARTSTSKAQGQDDHLALTLHRQRSRVEQFLAVQRERLDQSGVVLADQLEDVLKRLAHGRLEAEHTSEELQHRTEHLDRQTKILSRFKEELESYQVEREAALERWLEQQTTLSEQIRIQQETLDSRLEELAKRQAEVVAAERDLHRRQEALDLAEQARDTQGEHVAELRRRLEGELADLAGQREEMATRRARTEGQRRRIADDLRAQRSAQQKELERHRADIERLESDQLSKLRRELQAATQKCDDLSQQIAALSQNRDQLDQKFAAREEELSKQTAEIESLRGNVRELIASLDTATDTETQLKAKIASLGQEADRMKAHLDKAKVREEQLTAELQAVRSGEFSTADQLENAQRRETELTAQSETLQEREAELNNELKTLQKRETGLTAQLEASGQRETELTAQSETLQEREAARDEQMASLEQRCEQLQQQLTDAEHAAAGVGKEELESLRKEHEGLAEHLAETESQLQEARRRLAEAEQIPPADADAEDAKRRYELALEDLHELRQKNEQLEAELAKPSSAASSTHEASGQRIDWETEKSRILAALESEHNEDKEEDDPRRLDMEQVVQATDKALQEKDKELAELKQVLAQQSSNLESVAVGAAALGEIVDNDAIIIEQRESIGKLKEEWEGKLRVAEVEISVERAKLARERQQLDEKLRVLGTVDEEAKTEDETSKPTQPSRGRWLSRLGLADREEDK